MEDRALPGKALIVLITDETRAPYVKRAGKLANAVRHHVYRSQQNIEVRVASYEIACRPNELQRDKRKLREFELHGFARASSYRVSLHSTISAAARKLEDLGIVCLNSPSVSSVTNDKFRVHSLLSSAGIETPRSVLLNRSSTACDVAEAIRFIDSERVVIKPNAGRRGVGLRYFRSTESERVWSYLNFLREHGCGDALIQERLDGYANANLRVLVFGDGMKAIGVVPTVASFRLDHSSLSLACHSILIDTALLASERLQSFRHSETGIRAGVGIRQLCARVYELIVDHCLRAYRRSSCMLCVELMFKRKRDRLSNAHPTPLILEVNSMPRDEGLARWWSECLSRFRQSEAAALARMALNETLFLPDNTRSA